MGAITAVGIAAFSPQFGFIIRYAQAIAAQEVTARWDSTASLLKGPCSTTYLKIVAGNVLRHRLFSYSGTLN